MFKIWFRLREVDEIQPWGAPERPTLSWFGLSDGWYDVELGGNQQFSTLDSSLPGVDYQIVRLWEDWIDTLRDLADHGRGYLSSGHLAGAPQLLVVRKAQQICCSWSDGDASWCSPQGETTLSVGEFWTELNRFHHEFMAAMARRVEAVCQNPPEGTTIDLVHLRREQDERPTWFPKNVS